MQQKDYPNGKAPKGIAFRSSENGNENYAVDSATNERIEDEANTATCLNIIGEFASDCGIAENTKITSTKQLLTLLQGAEVGIKVRAKSDDKVEYHYSMPVDRVKATEDAEA